MLRFSNSIWMMYTTSVFSIDRGLADNTSTEVSGDPVVFFFTRNLMNSGTKDVWACMLILSIEQLLNGNVNVCACMCAELVWDSGTVCAWVHATSCRQTYQTLAWKCCLIHLFRDWWNSSMEVHLCVCVYASVCVSVACLFRDLLNSWCGYVFYLAICLGT